MRLRISIFFLLLTIFCSSVGLSQDSLNLEDLQPFAYPFDVTETTMRGKGADLLKKVLAKTQITMLGDNNRSKLEAKFTLALLHELDQLNYQNLVVETGIGSNPFLKKLAQSSDNVVANFKSFNEQYGLKRNGKLLAPIPDFNSVESAQFLQFALQQNWSPLALGTDAWTSYAFLLDELYANLDDQQSINFASEFKKAKADLMTACQTVTAQTNDQIATFIQHLERSTAFQNFLQKMAQIEQNTDLIAGLNFSLDHWKLYGQRDFYTKNKKQAARNKTELAKMLQVQQIDFQKNKLFIKMWVNHLAKGTTVSGFYGVGNMLQELAAYYGKESINIAIARRYYEENGVVKDILAQANHYINFKELLPLGKKDQWVLVDLRPFNEAFFWKGKQMSVAMHKIMARYDFLVIPKTDSPATPN
ncbi:MAG: hypothetical protein AAGJ18_11940 [Bacteroidota bacterium]